MSTKFPIFESSQLLTARHLNDLRRYLEDHARHTRSWVLGTGIVAGMQLSRVAQADGDALRVHCGAGISSEGHLMLTPEVDLAFALPFVDKGEYPIFGQRKTTPEGDTWEMRPNVWELRATADVRHEQTSEGQAAAASAQRRNFITQLTALGEGVIVAYLEAWEIDLQFCTLEDCNDRGKEGYRELRFLLVPSTYVDDQSFLAKTTRELQLLMVPRILDFDSRDDIYTLYKEACGECIARLETAWDEHASDLLEHIVPTMKSPPTSFDDLRASLRAVPRRQIQVFYDFLRDVSATWNAIVQRARHSGYQACPKAEAHPRHLCLGTPAAQDGQWRHHYRGPFAAGGIAETEFTPLFRLVKKLEGQLTHFDTEPPHGPVGILPQDGLAPCTSLVPYYYRKDGLPDLEQFWAPSGLRASHAQQLVHSWHERQLGATQAGAHPLYDRYDEQQFYRVEGLLGLERSTALRSLREDRNQYGLSFDIVELTSLDGLDDHHVRAFAKNPALERSWSLATWDLQELYTRVYELLGAITDRPELQAIAHLAPDLQPLRRALRRAIVQFSDKPQALPAGELDLRHRNVLTEAATTIAGLAASVRSTGSAAIHNPASLAASTRIGAQHVLHIGLLLAHLRAEILALFGARRQLNELRSVAAEIVHYTANAPHLFHNFVRLHPGIEHGAGVPRGGTLLVVHDGTHVEADFYLPYRWCGPCDQLTSPRPLDRVVPLVVETRWSEKLELFDGLIDKATRVELKIDNKWIQLRKTPEAVDWGGRVHRTERGICVYPIGSAEYWRGGRYQPEGKTGWLVAKRLRSRVFSPLELCLRLTGRDDVPTTYWLWLILHPPLVLAQDDVAVTVSGHPVEIRSLPNDLIPHGGYSAKWTTAPGHGELVEMTGEPGAWRYTPERDFIGIDEFTYELRVSGPYGVQSSSARVTIHVVDCCEREVEPPPPPPVGCRIRLSRLWFCDDDDTVYHFRTRGAVTSIEGPGVRPLWNFDLGDVRIPSIPDLGGLPPVVDPPRWPDEWPDGWKPKFPPKIDPHNDDRTVRDILLSLGNDVRGNVEILQAAHFEEERHTAAVELAEKGFTTDRVLALGHVLSAELDPKNLEDLKIGARLEVESSEATVNALKRIADTEIEEQDLELLLNHTQRDEDTRRFEHAVEAASGLLTANETEREHRRLIEAAASVDIAQPKFDILVDWHGQTKDWTDEERLRTESLNHDDLSSSDHEAGQAWAEAISDLTTAETTAALDMANLALEVDDWATAVQVFDTVDAPQLSELEKQSKWSVARREAADAVEHFHASTSPEARAQLLAAEAVDVSERDRESIANAAKLTIFEDAELVGRVEALVGEKQPTWEELNAYSEVARLSHRDQFAAMLALANKTADFADVKAMARLSSGRLADADTATRDGVVEAFKGLRPASADLGFKSASALLKLGSRTELTLEKAEELVNAGSFALTTSKKRLVKTAHELDTPTEPAKAVLEDLRHALPPDTDDTSALEELDRVIASASKSNEAWSDELRPVLKKNLGKLGGEFDASAHRALELAPTLSDSDRGLIKHVDGITPRANWTTVSRSLDIERTTGTDVLLEEIGPVDAETARAFLHVANPVELSGDEKSDLLTSVHVDGFEPSDLATAAQVLDAGVGEATWKALRTVGVETDDERQAVFREVADQFVSPEEFSAFWASMAIDREQRETLRRADAFYGEDRSAIRRSTRAYARAQELLGEDFASAAMIADAKIPADIRNGALELLSVVEPNTLRAGAELHRARPQLIARGRAFLGVAAHERDLLVLAYGRGLGREQLMLGRQAGALNISRSDRALLDAALKLDVDTDTRGKILDAARAERARSRAELAALARSHQLIEDLQLSAERLQDLAAVAKLDTPVGDIEAYLRAHRLDLRDEVRAALPEWFAFDGDATIRELITILMPETLHEGTRHALWSLVLESGLTLSEQRLVLKSPEETSPLIGRLPPQTIKGGVGKGKVVVGDISLPIHDFDIRDFQLPEVDRDDLRVRMGWVFEPRKAGPGTHTIKYTCFTATGRKQHTLIVHVLAHPKLQFRDRVIRDGDAYKIQLRATETDMETLPDDWQLTWKLPGRGSVPDLRPNVVLPHNREQPLVYKYRAVLTHPKLRDCVASFSRTLRWPQARRDLLEKWLGEAKIDLSQRIKELVDADELLRDDIATASDLAELVADLTATKEGEERWASSDLDESVLPKFKRTLDRLKKAHRRLETTTPEADATKSVAQAYGHTTAAALGYLWASRNQPTGEAQELLETVRTQLTSQGLRTPQLRARFEELNSDEGADSALLAFSGKTLESWD